jgi:hypothetical protein
MMPATLYCPDGRAFCGAAPSLGSLVVYVAICLPLE